MKQDTSGEDVREVQASRDEAVGERDFAEGVIDTLREPLLVLDADLKVMSANHSFYSKFAVTREQTEGRRLYDLGNGQWDIPQLREALEMVIPQDSSFEDIEVEHEFPHIGRKVICLNGRRLERAHGGAPAVLLAMEDVTERRDAERDRDRAFEELERSNAELEQFAYIASHDLQEPLRMVMSYSQLLERRYSDKLDEDAKEFISYAVNGAARMQQLINDLLAYSRVGTRGGPLEPTDCNAVVSQARDNVQMSAGETGADISWDELPVVMADSGQLVQLLQNLMSNAIKYRREDRAPEVHISAALDGDFATFSVRDNGVGVAPEQYDRVFQPFRRARKDDRSGTGMGLAICKKIVERHGGTMWLESQPGEGSTFYFTVPLAHGGGK